MHFTNGAILNGRVVHTLLASILAVGLAVFGVGCGGAGSNGEGDGNGDGNGDGGDTVVPAAPTGLAGTSGDGQVDLEWASSAGADTYNVYRSTSSTDGATGDPITSGVSETAYTDSSDEVTNGTKYYYRVTAVNPEDEESDGSGEIAKTPFSSPPDRPEE